MPSTWYSVVIDAADPVGLGRFWAAALDRQLSIDDEGEVLVVAVDGTPGPLIELIAVPEVKSIKNRLHIDLRPDHRDAEVERLLALGATRADVGQVGDETWVVLADPEGNEFCVLEAS